MRQDGQIEIPRPPEECSVMAGLLWCTAHNLAKHVEEYTRSGQMYQLHPEHIVQLVHATNDLYWLARHAANYDKAVEMDGTKIDKPWEN